MATAESLYSVKGRQGPSVTAFCVTRSVHRSGKKAYTGNVLFAHLNQTMNSLKKCFAVMFILGFKPGKEGSKTISQERKNL